jgi:hypothetical protein
VNGHVVVLVPMLGRPHRVDPLLATLTATAPDVRPLFLVSPADTAVHHAIDAAGADRLTVDGPHPGDYARKINAGYRASTEPLLFLGADDLAFHPNWLEEAVGRLGPGIGVVGTNDLGSPRVITGQHATHSLVTRAYADEFGTIDQSGIVLHEGYPHEFVDDELVETAKHRNAWAFARFSHVEHLHPAWGKAPVDKLYLGQRRRMDKGRRIYQERRHLWT